MRASGEGVEKESIDGSGSDGSGVLLFCFASVEWRDLKSASEWRTVCEVELVVVMAMR